MEGGPQQEEIKSDKAEHTVEDEQDICLDQVAELT